MHHLLSFLLLPFCGANLYSDLSLHCFPLGYQTAFMQRMLWEAGIERVNPWSKVGCFESILLALTYDSIFWHVNLSVLYHFTTADFAEGYPPHARPDGNPSL